MGLDEIFRNDEIFSYVPRHEGEEAADLLNLPFFALEPDDQAVVREAVVIDRLEETPCVSLWGVKGCVKYLLGGNGA